MADNPEEARKEAARKAVTEGLMDPPTIHLLSAAGEAAKVSRTTSSLMKVRSGQQKPNTTENLAPTTKDIEVDKKKEKEEQKASG